MVDLVHSSITYIVQSTVLQNDYIAMYCRVGVSIVGELYERYVLYNAYIRMKENERHECWLYLQCSNELDEIPFSVVISLQSDSFLFLLGLFNSL